MVSHAKYLSSEGPVDLQALTRLCLQHFKLILHTGPLKNKTNHVYINTLMAANLVGLFCEPQGYVKQVSPILMLHQANVYYSNTILI